MQVHMHKTQCILSCLCLSIANRTATIHSRAPYRMTARTSGMTSTHQVRVCAVCIGETQLLQATVTPGPLQDCVEIIANIVRSHLRTADDAYLQSQQIVAREVLHSRPLKTVVCSPLKDACCSTAPPRCRRCSACGRRAALWFSTDSWL